MCGIAGIVAADGLSAEDREIVGAMTSVLAHRGPDDSGAHVDSFAALGHRRLSVVDPVGARQPLWNEDGTIHAVVNGEFYNFPALRRGLIGRRHRLESRGDAECLVHLYEERGDAAIDALSGMFAFGLWDQRRRRLLLVRDRLGVKPLYYAIDGRRIVFGSEIKAVIVGLGVLSDIDPEALLDYLTYSFIPSPKTIYRGIAKLPPGHLLVFENGRATVRSYWRPTHRGWDARDIDEISEELWERIGRATKSRMVADVPIGAFLSGGLDSTAVAAAMARASTAPVLTLSCGFDEADFDERDHAAAIASQLGADHQSSLITADTSNLVDKLAWHFDEPFADASAIPMFCISRQARRRATVMLSGDGGDELLAGYRRYRFDRYEDQVRRLVPGALRRPLFGLSAALYPHRPWMPRPLRARATLRNLATDPATAHGQSIATMPPADARRLLHPDLRAACRDYDPLETVRKLYQGCDAPDHLSKCQYVDMRMQLADGILTKVDRASMAHGLEVRSPLLDYQLAEFCLSIPPAARIRRRQGKWPLRLAVARHVSPEAARRVKSGFDVPIDEWFRGPLRERFRDEGTAAGARSAAWISRPAVERLWSDHLAGRANHGATLWKLAMLESWAKTFLKSRVQTLRQQRVTDCSASSPTVSARLTI